MAPAPITPTSPHLKAALRLKYPQPSTQNSPPEAPSSAIPTQTPAKIRHPTWQTRHQSCAPGRYNLAHTVRAARDLLLPRASSEERVPEIAHQRTSPGLSLATTDEQLNLAREAIWVTADLQRVSGSSRRSPEAPQRACSADALAYLKDELQTSQGTCTRGGATWKARRTHPGTTRRQVFGAGAPSEAMRTCGTIWSSK